MEKTETKYTFEDWIEAGKQYAADHPELEFWPFQVNTMASDWAWRMEGIEITSESIEDAYDDWTNGMSPYSVHSRATPNHERDGYDFHGMYNRKKAKNFRKMVEYAISIGIDRRNIDRFFTGLRVDITTRECDIDNHLKRWYTGELESSPHHVPLDRENYLLREARINQLTQLYPAEDFDIFFKIKPIMTKVLEFEEKHKEITAYIDKHGFEAAEVKFLNWS